MGVGTTRKCRGKSGYLAAAKEQAHRGARRAKREHRFGQTQRFQRRVDRRARLPRALDQRRKRFEGEIDACDIGLRAFRIDKCRNGSARASGAFREARKRDGRDAPADDQTETRRSRADREDPLRPRGEDHAADSPEGGLLEASPDELAGRESVT